jgi:hypothetical protein
VVDRRYPPEVVAGPIFSERLTVERCRTHLFPPGTLTGRLTHLPRIRRSQTSGRIILT